MPATHIFAKTDPEVACGLAWAHAEDDFKTIQLLMVSTKGLPGRHLCKKGAAADYVIDWCTPSDSLLNRVQRFSRPTFAPCSMSVCKA